MCLMRAWFAALPAARLLSAAAARCFPMTLPLRTWLGSGVGVGVALTWWQERWVDVSWSPSGSPHDHVRDERAAADEETRGTEGEGRHLTSNEDRPRLPRIDEVCMHIYHTQARGMCVACVCYREGRRHQLRPAGGAAAILLQQQR